MMKRLVIYGVITIMLVAGTAGCLFEPREAEDPAGEEETCWITPLSTTDVFNNLDCGFESVGNSSYERALHPEFTFAPRLGYDGPGDFTDWDVTQEMDFLTNLKGDYQGERSIRFGDEQGQFESVDEETNEATYIGEYRITLEVAGSDPDIYAGKAEFVVERGTKGWVLRKWTDTDIVGSFPSSANLRGAYQQ